MQKEECMFIVRQNRQKHYYDMKCLDKINSKPQNGNVVYGPDNKEEIVTDIELEDFYDVEEILTVKRDSKVMLVENLDPAWGLCNGSMGTVYDVILNKENELEYVLVQFGEEYTGPSFIKGVDRIVPIAKEYKSKTPKEGLYKGKKFWKVKFPLVLGYSFCLEKVQGMTLNHNA